MVWFGFDRGRVGLTTTTTTRAFARVRARVRAWETRVWGVWRAGARIRASCGRSRARFGDLSLEWF